MAIQDHFIHTITHKPEGVPDEWGEPVESATPMQQTVNARVEWDRKIVMGRDGRDRVCSGIVFVGNDIDLIKAGDLIEFEGRDYIVEKADRCETHVPWGGDPDREHWEVYIV